MKKLLNAIRKSPINYLSDLFVVTMVMSYLFTVVLMTIFAIYATVANCDNSIWSDLGILVAVPVSAGGALWLIRCTFNHHDLNKLGKEVEADFPDIEPGEEEDLT